MILNYFRVFLRSLRKHRQYYIINIATLAAGLVCLSLITVYIAFELSFDKLFVDYKRIYRVVWDSARTPNPLAPAIYEEIAAVENTTRMIFSHSGLVVIDSLGNSREEKGYAVDSTFFDVFSYEFIHGSRDALAIPSNVVITERFANKMFGKSDVVGEVIWLDVPMDNRNFQVAGVLKDPPPNSQFGFDVLTRYRPHLANNWEENLTYTYVKLKRDANPAGVQEELRKLVHRHSNASPSDLLLFRLQPIHEQHFESELSFDFGTHASKPALAVLGTAGLLIMSISCINFVNLTTAKASDRQKEVSVRKVIGASVAQLRTQILSESIVVSLLAAMLSWIAVYLSLPLFQQLTQVDFLLAFAWVDERIRFGLVFLPVLVGLLSGIYPAWVIAGYSTGNAGRNLVKPANTVFRKLLVGIQFVISSFLIIGAVTITRQFDLILNHDLGFNKGQTLVFNIGPPGLRNRIETIRTQLLENPAITHVSAALTVPGDLTYTMPYSVVENPDENSRLTLAGLYVDLEFVKNMEIEVVEGRAFETGIAADTMGFLINQSGAQLLMSRFGETWEEPVGKTLHYFRSSQNGYYLAKSGPILGIVKDFHFYSLHEKVEPLAIQIDHNLLFKLILKCDATKLSSVIPHVKKVWNNAGINRPISYVFLDDHFENAYERDERFQSMFLFFALIAILISAAGLYGLVLYSTEKRSKEISIRKILGAGPTSILILITSDIFILVCGAFIVSSAPAYIAMREWLSQFAVKASLGAEVFLISFGSCILICGLTIVIRIARVLALNPVVTLKNQ